MIRNRNGGNPLPFGSGAGGWRRWAGRGVERDGSADRLVARHHAPAEKLTPADVVRGGVRRRCYIRPRDDFGRD